MAFESRPGGPERMPYRARPGDSRRGTDGAVARVPRRGRVATVISLWSVDDKATAELMAHFYRHMLSPERLTPSASLRAATLEMRRQPRWRAPYFWAGFLLQGDWN